MGSVLRRSAESLTGILSTATEKAKLPQLAKKVLGRVRERASTVSSSLFTTHSPRGKVEDKDKSTVQSPSTDNWFNRTASNLFSKEKKTSGSTPEVTENELKATQRDATVCLTPIPIPPIRPARARDINRSNSRGETSQYQEETLIDLNDTLDNLDPYKSSRRDETVIPRSAFEKREGDTIWHSAQDSYSPIETGILGKTSADQSLESIDYETQKLEETFKDLRDTIERDYRSKSPKRNLFSGRGETRFSTPTKFPSALATSTPKVKQIQFDPKAQYTKEPMARSYRRDEIFKDLNPQILAALPRFSGDHGESIIDFFKKYNRFINSFNLGRSKAYLILPLILEGKAERALDEIENEKSAYDYESLQQKLLEKLCTKEGMLKAKYGLDVPMKPTEKLSEYADRVRQNFLSAYPDMKESDQGRMMSDAFCKGVVKPLQKKLITKTFKNINEALAKAEEQLTYMELIKDDAMENRLVEKLAGVMEKSRLEDKKTEAEVNYINRDQGYYNQGYNNQGFNRFSNNSFRGRGNFQRGRGGQGPFNDRNRCWNCGSAGHFARSCSQQQGIQFNGFENRNKINNQRGNRRGNYSRNQSRERDGDYSRNQSRERGDQRNGNDRRGVRFSNPSVNTLMLVCVLAMMIPASAEVFFRCESREPAALMLSHDESILPCIANFDNSKALFTKAVVYRTDQIEPPRPGYSCSEIRTVICLSGLSGIFNITMNTTTTEQYMYLDECVKLERTKDSKHGKLIQEKNGIWKTQITKIADLPLYGTKCTTMYSMLLRYGTVFEIRKGIAVSDIANLNGCPIERGNCLGMNQTTVWEYPEHNRPCPEIYGHFDVILNDQVVLIPNLTKILIPRSHDMNRNECLRRNTLRLSEHIQLTFPNFPEATSLYDITTGRKRVKRFVPPIIKYSPLVQLNDTREYLTRLLDSRESFGQDPVSDYMIREALIENRVTWTDVLFQNAAYSNMTPVMSVLRALIFRRYKNEVRAQTRTWSDEKLRNMLWSDYALTAREAIDRARIEGSGDNQSLMEKIGYRLYADDVSSMDSYYLDDFLNREVHYAKHVDRETRDRKMKIFLNSKLVKDVAVLNAERMREFMLLSFPLEEPKHIIFREHLPLRNSERVAKEVKNFFTQTARVIKDIPSTMFHTQSTTTESAIIPLEFMVDISAEPEASIRFSPETTTVASISTTADPYPLVNMDTELGQNDINRVFIDTCEMKKQKSMELRLQMQAFPTKTMQKLLGRYDIRADRISDSIFSISLCEEVYPDQIKENRRSLVGNGLSCYDYLPIVVNGTELFVNEETLHVYEKSPRRACKSEDGKQKRAETSMRIRSIRAQQGTVKNLSEGTSKETIPILGFMNGEETLKEIKEVSVAAWDKVTQKLEEIKKKGIEVAKDGSSKVVNFAVEAKEKVIEYTTGWLRFIRNLFLGILGCVIIGATLFIIIKYWLWREITSCGIGLLGTTLRRAKSEPTVNYILRSRESRESLDSRARCSRFLQQREEEEQMELINFQVRGVRSIPTLRLVTICTCLMTISLVPGVDAADRDESVIQSNWLISVVAASIFLIIIGIQWYKGYCERCAQITISEIHGSRRGILVTNKGNARVVFIPTQARSECQGWDITKHLVLKYIVSHGMISTIASRKGVKHAQKFVNFLRMVLPEQKIKAVRTEIEVDCKDEHCSQTVQGGEGQQLCHECDIIRHTSRVRLQRWVQHERDWKEKVKPEVQRSIRENTWRDGRKENRAWVNRENTGGRRSFIDRSRKRERSRSQSLPRGARDTSRPHYENTVRLREMTRKYGIFDPVPIPNEESPIIGQNWINHFDQSTNDWEEENTMGNWSEINDVKHIRTSEKPQVNLISKGVLPHLTMRFNGVAVQSLVDSGSNVSIIRANTFNRLNNAKLRDTEVLPAKTASNGRIPFLGECDVKVKIESLQFSHTFLVTSDDLCPSAALVGMDLIQSLTDRGLPVTFTKDGLRIGSSDSKVHDTSDGEDEWSDEL